MPGKLLEPTPRPAGPIQDEKYPQMANCAGRLGAPSYVLNGEIFWGQDRLDFVERALAL